jgi:hypothetical protein
MAAKVVNICFYGMDSASKPLACIEPRWWDAEVLCADSRFTMTNESGSYFDWGTDRSPLRPFRLPSASGMIDRLQRSRRFPFPRETL